MNDIFLEGDSNFFLYTRALLMLLLFDVAFLFSIGIQPSFTLSSAIHFSYMGLKYYYDAYEDLMFSLIFFSIYWKFAIFLRIELFQWFFILLSVLPGRCFEIYAHLFPLHECNKNKIHSSSFDHSPLLMFGSKWLYQRYLHCFPCRSGTNFAILVQFLGPYYWTNCLMRSSSSCDHGLLWAFCLEPSEATEISGRLSIWEFWSMPSGIIKQISYPLK